MSDLVTIIEYIGPSFTQGHVLLYFKITKAVQDRLLTLC